MITHVFLFPNGNVACTDEDGKQVPAWQKPLLCDHLRDMLDAGVVNSATQIETATGVYRLDEFVNIPIGDRRD
jgi:hypothetical protein